MHGYRLATPAQRDLVEILDYLLEHAGGRVALEMESRLRAAFQTIAKHPGVGHRRHDLTSKLALFLSVSRYMLVYRIEDEFVVVFAILDGSRDVKSILNDRPF